MRLLCSIAALAATAASVAAFAPVPKPAVTGGASALQAVTTTEVQEQQAAALAAMKAKDATSRAIAPDDLEVIFEDEHIVVVNKPAGVLTVPGKDLSNQSLNAAVFARFGAESGRMDKMVAHRLGMDTSGLIVFARTDAALRGLNTAFRSRRVARKYEALVCGHVAQDEGAIDLPLMRDCEHIPFMRVSTIEHQTALLDLDEDHVGKQLLELPKESLTKYEVIAREDLAGHDVSRLTLTPVSGRMHQLNVHCAALGHPMVGDAAYGFGGAAAARGGVAEAPAGGASDELQGAIAAAHGGKPVCVHAKSLGFRHPITGKDVSFESKASF